MSFNNSSLMYRSHLASRPSHYIVLKDDNFGYNADKSVFHLLSFEDPENLIGARLDPLHRLQELCWVLCHVYAKANRSVSIPAPVYCKSLLDTFFTSEENADACQNPTDADVRTQNLLACFLQAPHILSRSFAPALSSISPLS
jgi:hypothetical protein